MEEELRRLLHHYIAGRASLDEVTEWLARNIWGAPNIEHSLVDEVAIELAFLDDGSVEEAYFREQVILLITNLVTNIVLHQYPFETSTGAAASPPTHEQIVTALVP